MALKLAPPERKTLARSVRDQLLERIRRGEVRPGDRLPTEHELMAMLGVGRSSIREALQALALMGIIDARTRRGYIVNDTEAYAIGAADLTPASLLEAERRELIEARQWLEVAIGELILKRATEKDFHAMEQALERVRRATAQGKNVTQVSADFHLAMAAAAHNSVLFKIMRSIRTLLLEEGTAKDRLDRHRVHQAEAHELLYEALCSGDPQRVRHEILHHLADSLEDSHRVAAVEVEAHRSMS
ncbi:MAG: FadR/GntR family transcriptional regulator [Chloroflexota bacterium]